MPAPRSTRPPASSVTIPPAMSRPWLVTLRSMMKSTIPTKIRITPTAGDIIGTEPAGRETDIRMTVASSLESDCTAPYSDDSQRDAGRAGTEVPALNTPFEKALLRSWPLSCGRSARSGSRGSCSASRTRGYTRALLRWRVSSLATGSYRVEPVHHHEGRDSDPQGDGELRPGGQPREGLPQWLEEHPSPRLQPVHQAGDRVDLARDHA